MREKECKKSRTSKQGTEKEDAEKRKNKGTEEPEVKKGKCEWIGKNRVN